MSGKQILFSFLVCSSVFYALALWVLAVMIHNRIKRSRCEWEQREQEQPVESPHQTVFGYPIRSATAAAAELLERHKKRLEPFEDWAETKGEDFFSVLDE